MCIECKYKNLIVPWHSVVENIKFAHDFRALRHATGGVAYVTSGAVILAPSKQSVFYQEGKGERRIKVSRVGPFVGA